MSQTNAILTEAGTNELEILIFGIASECYGINVAKVREIIKLPQITKPPHTSPMVEGVIHLREHLIPLVNLRKALGYPEKVKETSDLVIITEYHQTWFGFIADRVDTIVRISWKDIEPPPESVQHSNVITGIAHLEDKLALMLDVETLTDPLLKSLNGRLNTDAIESSLETLNQRSQKRILAADDSGVIRSLVRDQLEEAGYTNIVITVNGKDAWERIESDPSFDLLITDIEMPQLDGLLLTKLIKNDDRYKHIPIVIFSSIISEDNRNKGEQVGADEQISKPEIHRLIGCVDRLLGI